MIGGDNVLKIKIILLIVFCILAVASYIGCQYFRSRPTLSLVCALITMAMLAATVLDLCIFKDSVKDIEDGSKASQNQVVIDNKYDNNYNYYVQ